MKANGTFEAWFIAFTAKANKQTSIQSVSQTVKKTNARPMTAVCITSSFASSLQFRAGARLSDIAFQSPPPTPPPNPPPTPQ